MNELKLGCSIAISWAWGTSLILGMEIARTKGIAAFFIWFFANCTTLLLFGSLYKRRIINPKVLDNKIVKVFTTLIQMFCLIIQTKILYETLCIYLSTNYAYIVTVLFSCSLVLWMYFRGLMASIFTDLIQGSITIVALMVMLGYSFMYLEPEVRNTSSTVSDIEWAIWSACILLSGILTDIQHWQRAEVSKNQDAFAYATMLFGLYLSCVLLLSTYQFDHVLNAILLIAVIGVTTSTIDSIAVALHRNLGKFYGTLIGLLICIFFGSLLELSVLSLWSYFGIIRVGLAVYILYWCYRYKNETNQRRLNKVI